MNKYNGLNLKEHNIAGYNPLMVLEQLMDYKRICLAIGIAYVFSMALLACGSKPVVVNERKYSPLSIPSNVNILILKPNLRIEQIQDEKILDPADYQGELIESTIGGEAKTVLNENGYAVGDQSALDTAPLADLSEQLKMKSFILVQGTIDEDSRKVLNEISSVNSDYAVLLNTMHVKVGPGTHWDPFSGSIASSMSSTRLQAVLISPGTGQILWRNDILLRKLPKIDDNQFIEAIELLYKTFPTKKEN